MNRRMPNGTYGGVRGRGREAPAYSIIFHAVSDVSVFTIFKVVVGEAKRLHE